MSPSAPAGAPSAGRILLVDDNVDATRIMRLMLEIDGHQVRVVNDSTAALAAAREFVPDIALIDIGMPGLDGYGVARLLRAEAGLPQPLLVAITGYDKPDDARRSREAGFDRHLTKPVERKLLQELIAQRLAR